MRFCENCGTQLGDGVRFCPNCGAQVAQNARQAQTDTQAAAQTAQPETTAQAAVTPAANTAEKTVGTQEPLHATVVTQTPAPKTNGFPLPDLCSVSARSCSAGSAASTSHRCSDLFFRSSGFVRSEAKRGAAKGLPSPGLCSASCRFCCWSVSVCSHRRLKFTSVRTAILTVSTTIFSRKSEFCPGCQSSRGFHISPCATYSVFEKNIGGALC